MRDTDIGRGLSTRLLRTKLRRDLRRRRGQVAAMLTTIVIGVALFGATFDAYRNLGSSYLRTYDRLAFADLTISGGDTDRIASVAEATPGVTEVAIRTQADVPLQVGDDHRLYGRIVGMPTSGQPSVDRVDVTAGSYLDPSEPTGVLVEQHLADHFHIRPGATMRVLLGSGWTDVRVVGIAVSPEYLWPARSRQQIFTTPEDFGVIFAPESLVARAESAAQVPQLLLRYAAQADATELDSELSAATTRLGAADVITQEQQPSNAALQEDVDGFGELSLMFPLLFLGAAGMAAYLMLTSLVHAQRGQIGTLRANGLPSRAILRHYLAYGVVIGVLGAVIGSAAGLVLGRLVTGVYTSSLSIPDTVVVWRPATPLLGVAFGLIAGSLAAWAPARSALRVSPAEAMRGAVPAGRGRADVLEKMLPPLRRLPARWRMTQRGIWRNPRRSLSTVLGVVLALVLVLASWGMVDTTQILVDRQFRHIELQSAQVFFTGPVTPTVVAAVSGVRGVRDAEVVVQVPVGIASGTRTYGTRLSAFSVATAMHRFRSPGGSDVALPEHGVLLGEAMRGLLGIDRGDTVVLTLTSLSARVATTVAGFVSEPLGTPAYIALPELESLLSGADPPVEAAALAAPGVGSVMVRERPEADPSTVRTALGRLPGVAVAIDSRSVYDTVQDLLGFFYAFVGMMLVFGCIMAFALVFNTTSVNIAERTVELATLRANGFGLGALARLLTGENLLLTLIGVAVGIPLGVGVASQFMSSFSSDLFQFDLQIRPRTLVISASAMIAVALLSEIPGIRKVGRLDLGRVVRERSQ